MWYFNGQVIKTPKAIIKDGITHPKAIFRDSTMLTSLGIKPYREVSQDSRYYWQGSYSVNTSGDEVVGTYAGTARDLADLRTFQRSQNYFSQRSMVSTPMGNDILPSLEKAKWHLFVSFE